MSEIKAGDLVMVVRVTHECGAPLLGMIATVKRIHPPQPRQCPVCGKRDLFPEEAGAALWQPDSGMPLSWLKKIEGTETPAVVTRAKKKRSPEVA